MPSGAGIASFALCPPNLERIVAGLSSVDSRFFRACEQKYGPCMESGYVQKCILFHFKLFCEVR